MELRDAIMSIVWKSLNRRAEVLGALGGSPNSDEDKLHLVKKFIKLMSHQQQQAENGGTENKQGQFWANKG